MTTPIEALRHIRHHCDGNNWIGGENVYRSRKRIIKLCNDVIAQEEAQPAAKPLSGAEIVEVRDEHLPNQGDRFDCIAFARAVIAAHEAKT